MTDKQRKIKINHLLSELEEKKKSEMRAVFQNPIGS